ncbi:hypothetical protein BASA81_010544 [Batrachochytrium salamandrivorans]|nr:hypothetical protein BASA81_010544 [Batrachochytrium salamandrivorans]
MFVHSEERLGSTQGKWRLRAASTNLSTARFRFVFNNQVAVAKVGGPKIELTAEVPNGELSVEDVEETMYGFAILSYPENHHDEVTVSVPMVDSRSQAVMGEVVLVLEYPASQLQHRLFAAAFRRLLDGPPWMLIACLTLPFWFFTLFTSASWGFRQWLLVLPGYLYLSPLVPTTLGWALGELVTRFVLFGYSGRFLCEALHVGWWTSSRGHLHWRVTARNVGLGNPPAYPLEHFVHCKLFDMEGSMSLKHIRDCLLRRYKPNALAKVPDFKFLAKVHIDYVDVDSFFIDFHLHNGVLNLIEINRQLAEAEAYSVALDKGYLDKGGKMPNQLEVRIIRAVDLAKAARSSAPRSENPNDLRPWGKNATLDAFMEDEEHEEQQNEGELNVESKEDADSPETVFDPFVVVTLREDSQTTKTQAQTNLPMFDETVYFPVTDPATVVLVQVFSRHATTSNELLGQWRMTLKYLLSDPTYCWYEHGTLEVGEDRMIKGWFPLVNSKLTGMGMCGKIEMCLHWKYVAKLQREFSAPESSGLGQLQQASSELTLRMGDFETLKRQLNHSPLLFSLDRMSLRNTKAYIKDIFVSNEDKETDERGLPFAKVPQIDWQDEFKPKFGDPGLTLYDLLKRAAVGMGPKILDLYRSKANIGSTVASIVGPAISDQVAQGAHHIAKGEAFGPFRIINRGANRLAKSLATSFQVTHKRVTQNTEDKLKTPVDALDQDFTLTEVILEGHLARSAVGFEDAAPATLDDMIEEANKSCTFSKQYFELKGGTLFYRKNKAKRSSTPSSSPTTSVYGTASYKIPLASIQSIACFRDELMLNHGDCITRLRLPVEGQFDKESSDDPDEAVGPPSLASWLTAMQPRLPSSVVITKVS